MATLADYIDNLKFKKQSAFTYITGLDFNYPHPLAEVVLSGTLSYTIDETQFTSKATALTAYKYEFDINDVTTIPAWTRLFPDNTPLSSRPDEDNEAEFHLYHRPDSMYTMFATYFNPTGTYIVGDCVRTRYTRAVDTDPWVADPPDAAVDIDGYLYFFVNSGGGSPNSGGKDATVSPAFDGTPVSLDVSIDWGGTYSNLLPDFDLDAVERLPWDRTWDDVDTSSEFNTFVSDNNTADGGGHSGSSSLTVEFNNLP